MISLFFQAKKLIEGDISFIPQQQTKEPCYYLLPKANGKSTWKPYKARLPSEKQIKSWFEKPFKNTTGIAVICGKISKNLIALDYDDQETFKAHYEKIKYCLLDHPIQQSGREGGKHLFLRCDDDLYLKNEILAKDDNGKALIELKGDNLITIEPSLHPNGKHYKLIQGDFGNIQSLNLETISYILHTARELSVKKIKPIERIANQKRVDHSVINDFNNSNNIANLLKRYGYVVDQYGIKRPQGKTYSVHIKNNKSFHHSASDPLSNGFYNDCFNIYCFFEHSGNVKKATTTITRGKT